MKKYWKILLVLAGLGMLGAVLVYVFVINKAHPDYAAVKADYQTTTVDVFAAYRADATAAAEKFNGKMVELLGTLSHVEAEGQEVFACFVLEEGLFGPEGVRVRMLESERKQAQKLEEGISVKVKGYVTGYNESDVLLEHGSFVE